MRPFFLALLFFTSGFYLAWIIKPDKYLSESSSVNLSKEHTAQDLYQHIESLSQEYKPPTQKSLNSDSAENEFTSSQEKSKDSNKISAKARFIQLLSEHSFIDAMQLYADIERREPSSITPLKREALLFLKNNFEHSELFIDFSDAFLNHDYADTDILLVLAEYNIRQHYLNEAALSFELAYHYAEPERQSDVRTKFSAFNQKTIEHFSQQGDTQSLIDFYQTILPLTISTSLDQLNYAKVNIDADNIYLAKNQLEQITDDPRVGRQARELLKALEQKNNNINTQLSNQWQHAIPLTRYGQHYLIQTRFNGSTETDLLIDTGASLTTISQQTFDSVRDHTRFEFLQHRLFNTAGGVTRGQVYRVARFSIGDISIANIEIAVLDLPDKSQLKGLLGMNVLHRFRFHLDQDQSILYLNPRKKAAQ